MVLRCKIIPARAGKNGKRSRPRPRVSGPPHRSPVARDRRNSLRRNCTRRGEDWYQAARRTCNFRITNVRSCANVRILRSTHGVCQGFTPYEDSARTAACVDAQGARQLAQVLRFSRGRAPAAAKIAVLKRTVQSSPIVPVRAWPGVRRVCARTRQGARITLRTARYLSRSYYFWLRRTENCTCLPAGARVSCGGYTCT